MTFGFDLVTFDPLLNISTSPESFCRFEIFKYLTSLHENNFGRGRGGGGGLYVDITWVEYFNEAT